jgi:hypothetical protein
MTVPPEPGIMPACCSPGFRVESQRSYFTESTLHAINAAEIRCVEVGPRELKGIATPVRVFQAQAME